MVVDYFAKSSHQLVLRKFSDDGPFFLIRICKLTRKIVSVERKNSLPKNWTNDYIRNLKRTGDEIFNKNVAYA